MGEAFPGRRNNRNKAAKENIHGMKSLLKAESLGSGRKTRP